MLDRALETQLIGKRYFLHEELGKGGMGVVYRATDRLSGQVVALKRVTTPTDQLQFASRTDDTTNMRVALAQEFRTLASLRHPNIISVLDYGFDEERQPYFTMNLLDKPRTIKDAGLDQPVAFQVNLLIQVLQALAYLHRRGILHRDLKPGNVLVDDGQVKVLDFGLAAARDRSEGGSVVGTLAYIAPEVLQEQPTTEAADLYGLGVIAYEILAGRHPFEGDSVIATLNNVMTTEPDMTPLMGMASGAVSGEGVASEQESLASIIAKLLSKTPDERYKDANEVIRALCAAIGQPVPKETAAIRDSFLQAARFIGRESEMSQLSDALKEAIDGKGGAWLIGGQSGMGKSRLMDELRTLSLVRGAVAVRGHSISDGGVPYQVWREPLQRLALDTDLDDADAAVLKPLVSDISSLLERDIPDAPEVEPLVAQDRLAKVTEAVLRRQKYPVVMLLEDLHWAGSESIALLTRLTRITDAPLMIVGTYRNDEMPELPRLIPNARTIKLERLSPANIEELSESMLGVAGRQEAVKNLILRETEGNIYFVVEVVRALAEEVGQLDQIGTKTLPVTVFAGGVRRILERRLERIPADARPLLELAAIGGRVLDLQVLKASALNSDLNSWLQTCADAAVLEVLEDRWRFAHDKLRETLLENLAEDQRQNLHRKAAEMIETVYSGALDSYYPILAHHWSNAKDSARAVNYLGKAGGQALQNYANSEAIQFFTQALDLDKGGDALRRSLWERQIGQAQLGLGNIPEARVHLEKALALRGDPVPPTPGKVGTKMLGQLVKQLARRARPPRFAAPSQADYDLISETVRAYVRLGEVYYYSNLGNNYTIYATLRQVNLAEPLGPSPELAQTYGNMCIIAGLVPLPKLAEAYRQKALDTAKALGERFTLGHVLSRTSLYDIGVGHWEAMKKSDEEAAQIAGELGDRRLWQESSGMLALYTHYQGDYARAESLFSEIYESACQSENVQGQAWGLLGQAENLLPRNEIQQAIDLFTQSAKIVEDHHLSALEAIRAYGGLAQARLWQGDVKGALEAAEKTSQLCATAPVTGGYLLQDYTAPAAVYMTLWEKGDTDLSADELAKRAQQACKALNKFARVFPIGKTSALLYQGWYNWLSGQPAKANAAWQKSLEFAQKFALPYEEAMAHYEIGRHAPSGDPQRKEHLTQASAVFSRLEARYDLARVQSALNG